MCFVWKFKYEETVCRSNRERLNVKALRFCCSESSISNYQTVILVFLLISIQGPPIKLQISFKWTVIIRNLIVISKRILFKETKTHLKELLPIHILSFLKVNTRITQQKFYFYTNIKYNLKTEEKKTIFRFQIETAK